LEKMITRSNCSRSDPRGAPLRSRRHSSYCLSLLASNPKALQAPRCPSPELAVDVERVPEGGSRSRRPPVRKTFAREPSAASWPQETAPKDPKTPALGWRNPIGSRTGLRSSSTWSARIPPTIVPMESRKNQSRRCCSGGGSTPHPSFTSVEVVRRPYRWQARTVGSACDPARKAREILLEKS